MKLNKEKFLKTELGGDLQEIVQALDCYMGELSTKSQWEEPERCKKLRDDIKNLFAQLNVHKLVMKQFYGREYSFTRTDEYYGLTTEDENDWLIKEAHTSF